MATMSTKLYVLRITLEGISPTIWRRFVVPANIPLDRLHDVIQIVMGWQDSHLHEFIIGQSKYSERPESPEDGQPEGLFRLQDRVKRKGQAFEYHYDFADSWMHQVEVEETSYQPGPHEGSIECLDGKRACPPEDVGGAPGYHEFCKALTDSSHPESEELKEWSGGGFDPEKFFPKEVNLELLKYLRWSRTRLTRWELG